MTEAHFSTVKNGRNPLSRKAAEAIEREYGFRADWLLRGEEPIVTLSGPTDTGPIFDAMLQVPQGAAITKRPTAAVIRRVGYYCASCNGQVVRGLAECSHCGAMLDWEAEVERSPE